MGLFDFVGDITGANQEAEAAQKAAGVQAGYAQQGIGEVRNRFDDFVSLLSPYIGLGEAAVPQLSALAGLGTPEQEKAALARLEGSPIFQGLARQGENAILANASATGGLRGGNVQGSLAQFRPGLLQDFLNQRLSTLGGLTNLGQGTALSQGQAGLGVGRDIANLLGQKGAAEAGGLLAEGQRQRTIFGDILGIAETGAKVAGAF